MTSLKLYNGLYYFRTIYNLTVSFISCVLEYCTCNVPNNCAETQVKADVKGPPKRRSGEWEIAYRSDTVN